MPLQQFRALYREYINAFAACLLELASDPESPVLPRLERLVRERDSERGFGCKSIRISARGPHPAVPGAPGEDSSCNQWS